MRQTDERIEKPVCFSQIQKPSRDTILPSTQITSQLRFSTGATELEPSCLNCEAESAESTKCTLCQGKGSLAQQDSFLRFVEKVIDHKLESLSSPSKAVHRSLLFSLPQQANPQKIVTQEEIHTDFICNECGMDPIKGSRYHCPQCYDYDSCERCYLTTLHPHRLEQVSAMQSHKECKQRVLDRLLQKELLLKSTRRNPGRFSLY